MSDIVDKVRELSRIKADIAKLNDRRKELEAYFLERGGDDVVDTKFKSTVYADPDSQAAVTYTEAQALTIVYPHYLKETLGAMFPDIFEEAVKTEVKPKNKDIERMLIGMFTGNYTRSTPEEIIAQLPCGDKAKSALAKKLKGAKFETDRDNLMKIGGFSEQDAGDYAYLYAEAAVWQTFRSVAEMSGADEARLLRCIISAYLQKLLSYISCNDLIVSSVCLNISKTCIDHIQKFLIGLVHDSKTIRCTFALCSVNQFQIKSAGFDVICHNRLILYTCNCLTENNCLIHGR